MARLEARTESVVVSRLESLAPHDDRWLDEAVNHARPPAMSIEVRKEHEMQKGGGPFGTLRLLVSLEPDP